MRADDRPSTFPQWMRWVEAELRRLRNRPNSTPGGGSGVTSVNGDTGPAVLLVASEIPSSPTGTIAATDVQAAIAELDSEKISGVVFQDENTAIITAPQVDFQGAGVTVTAGTGEAIVTIPGGITWVQDINDPLSSTAGFATALSGTWAINAGVLRQSSAATPARITHNTKITPGSARAVEVEVAHISSSGAIRRMGMAVYCNNSAGTSMLVYLASADGTNWTVRVETDGLTLHFTSAALAYAGSGYIKIGAIARGNVVDVYLDEVFVATVAVPGLASSGSLEYSRVGLYTYSTTADFRNLAGWHPYGVPW